MAFQTAVSARTINVLVGEKTEQIELGDGKIVKGDTHFVERGADLPKATVICYCSKPYDLGAKQVVCEHADNTRMVYELGVRGEKHETRKINVRGMFQEKKVAGHYR